LNSVPLPNKTILMDAWVLERGLFFLFIHWFNESCVEGEGDRWRGLFKAKLAAMSSHYVPFLDAGTPEIKILRAYIPAEA
jgi:hypothetical protein